MAIRTSSARDVEALLQQLRSPIIVEREAAIARLRIIGPRARDRVIAIVADTSEDAPSRVAGLKVLEAFDDPRARRAAIAATAGPDSSVAIAAVLVLRPWLAHDDDTSALECVTAIVADATRSGDLRRVALDALSELPDTLTHPLIQRVAPQLAAAPPLDDAAVAAEWLAHHEDASFGVLHDLLCEARQRGQQAPDEAGRAAWLGLRAATHTLLARRGSKIALYDARELFEAAQRPLPLDLLVTMRTVGDLSCLEALARGWETVADDEWWRQQVRDSAVAIIARENPSSRNAVIKRVRTKWPGFLG